jgi:hypothetical protein
VYFMLFCFILSIIAKQTISFILFSVLNKADDFMKK